MLEYARWKYVVILLVLALSVLYAVPNVFPSEPAVQVTANRGASVDAALQQRVEAALKKSAVPFASSEIGKDGNLLVRIASETPIAAPPRPSATSSAAATWSR